MTIKFQTEISDRLTEDWTWLIGTNKKVILVSAIGDMFLTDDKGKIFWLDVGVGKLNMVAADMKEFERKLTDIEQVNEWFMINLTTQLRLSDKKLKDGQIYSYKRLPVIGGDYSVDNFAFLDIEVHFRFTAEIHRQIKDFPNGTRVNIELVE
ncbi:MAG: DUF1851 domain-containing protein [Cyclobacteriaceae bacterium]|nr:DUF1851 domain-containing protein [Cyclobacteriaceae bacterium]